MSSRRRVGRERGTALAVEVEGVGVEVEVEIMIDKESSRALVI